MVNNYEQIRAAEDDIELLKQEFLPTLRELIDAGLKQASREKREQLAQQAHQAAVRYFSRVESWVAESAYLRVHEDPIWRISLAGTCKAVLNSYIKYWDFLGRESVNLDIDLQERFRPYEDNYWMMQGMVRIEYPKHWSDLRQQFHARNLPTKGFDDEIRLHRLREGQLRRGKMTTERWIAVAFGFIFISVLLILTVIIDDPTQQQETNFRIVLALASSAIGAVIPGVLNLSGKLGGFTVRTAGALALFFIVFFWNPAVSGDKTPLDSPPTITDVQ